MISGSKFGATNVNINVSYKTYLKFLSKLTSYQMLRAESAKRLKLKKNNKNLAKCHSQGSSSRPLVHNQATHPVEQGLFSV